VGGGINFLFIFTYLGIFVGHIQSFKRQ
jgi:hypothetical protein